MPVSDRLLASRLDRSRPRRNTALQSARPRPFPLAEFTRSGHEILMTRQIGRPTRSARNLYPRVADS